MSRCSAPMLHRLDCHHFVPCGRAPAAGASFRQPAAAYCGGVPGGPAIFDAFQMVRPALPMYKPSGRQHGAGTGVRRLESGRDLFVDAPSVTLLEPGGDLFDEDDSPDVASCATSYSGSGWGQYRVWEASHATTSHVGQVRPPPHTQRTSLLVQTQAGQQDGHAPHSTERGARSPDTVESRTTVMLQHISYHISEQELRHELDTLGFTGKYDAIAMPRNQQRGRNLGYAFVNFVEPYAAAACIEVCGGRPFADARCGRTCSAEYSKNQGAGFIRDCLSAAEVKQNVVDITHHAAMKRGPRQGRRGL